MGLGGGGGGGERMKKSSSTKRFALTGANSFCKENNWGQLFKASLA